MGFAEPFSNRPGELGGQCDLHLTGFFSRRWHKITRGPVSSSTSSKTDLPDIFIEAHSSVLRRINGFNPCISNQKWAPMRQFGISPFRLALRPSAGTRREWSHSTVISGIRLLGLPCSGLSDAITGSAR